MAGLGKIRLNLLYDDNREELKVFVHEAAGLPGGDLPDPPDPQVPPPRSLLPTLTIFQGQGVPDARQEEEEEV